MDPFHMFRLAQQIDGDLKDILTIVVSGPKFSSIKFQNAIDTALDPRKRPDELIIIASNDYLLAIRRAFSEDCPLGTFMDQRLSGQTTVTLIGHDADGIEVSRDILRKSTYKPPKPSVH